MDEKDSKSILAYIIFYLLAQLFDDNPLSITKFANYFERNRVVLNVKSDLPVSKGLGSSASFLVVLTASITVINNLYKYKIELNFLSLQTEIHTLCY